MTNVTGFTINYEREYKGLLGWRDTLYTAVIPSGETVAADERKELVDAVTLIANSFQTQFSRLEAIPYADFVTWIDEVIATATQTEVKRVAKLIKYKKSQAAARFES
jgi:hypothetical protein